VQGPPPKRSDLFKRVVVAALGIPAALGLIYVGGWALGVLVAVVAALAAHEFYRLAGARGVKPFAILGVAASAGLVLAAVARPDPQDWGLIALVAVIGVTLASLGATVWLRWPGGEPLGATSVTVMGVLYAGVTLSFVPTLRWMPGTVPGVEGGSRWLATSFVLLPLLATWAGDSAAYFAGRAWGKTKLAPAASPGKTIVGAVAGLVASMLAAIVLSQIRLGGVPFLPLSVTGAGWIGLLVGAVGQVGDLAESVLKREANVKDSGALLPGHGGVLDRMDSLLFAVPVTWALLLAASIIR
jgi:phosphatidate cytidylyltransferase